eukprot:CAMPEP_0197743328 /NCGR_PEP_ID=MMETSP1435-20131217/34775_1 /TAXON_ID=426625 /ORGANISM="Chaetoceros brevis, Strain CCMP164" /LENGTH=121 /DNA_ID=CAMNT_0043334237 /DNA_START=237 /DNA_END=602 /DNA_ORIENTATION=-
MADKASFTSESVGFTVSMPGSVPPTVTTGFPATFAIATILLAAANAFFWLSVRNCNASAFSLKVLAFATASAAMDKSDVTFTTAPKTGPPFTVSIPLVLWFFNIENSYGTNSPDDLSRAWV